MMMFKLEKIQSVIRIIFGILSALLGLTVLFGWYTNNIQLIQTS